MWPVTILLVTPISTHGRRRSKYLGPPNFLPKKYMHIQPKISKAHLFDTSIFMRSLFTFNIFVAKFGNDLTNNSKAVANKDLSCDSSGITKMPKHNKSQHQNNGDKKSGEKIMQNKLYQEQI